MKLIYQHTICGLCHFRTGERHLHFWWCRDNLHKILKCRSISRDLIGHFELLQCRHYERDGVSNHQPHGCVLKRLFTRRSKNTSNLCVTGFCERNSPVNSPHKGPVTWKMFPFDDVIMWCLLIHEMYSKTFIAKETVWTSQMAETTNRVKAYVDQTFSSLASSKFVETTTQCEANDDKIACISMLVQFWTLTVDNSSPPGQNGRHFADDIFKCMNEKLRILIRVSLKFVPKGPINNKSALVQVMAWAEQATSHYLKKCLLSSLTHICGTRGRWDKLFPILRTRPPPRCHCYVFISFLHHASTLVGCTQMLNLFHQKFRNKTTDPFRPVITVTSQWAR